MTIVAEPTRPADSDPTPAPSDTGRYDATPIETDEVEERAPIRPVPLVIGWLLITIVGIAVVLVAVGPISEDRDQRALLNEYRAEIESASFQSYGINGIEVPTDAPALGAPVAIVDIERIGLSRVVVEGTTPEQTRQGPGHVVGTGGPGQPGNSVIVGRNALFGGAFADLDAIHVDDRILVTTAQGRSVYVVEHVGTHTIDEETSTEESAAAASVTTLPNITDPAPTGDEPAATDGESADEADEEPMVADGPLAVDDLYGPSPDDRLTLVTTASGTPGVTSDAVVVVARMDGQAFPPTPQGGRTPGNDGRSGTDGISAALILALLAYVVAVVGAVWLNRNVPWRSAYLLTAPVLVALTIVLADELANVLPAWT